MSIPDYSVTAVAVAGAVTRMDNTRVCNKTQEQSKGSWRGRAGNTISGKRWSCPANGGTLRYAGPALQSTAGEIVHGGPGSAAVRWRGHFLNPMISNAAA